MRYVQVLFNPWDQRSYTYAVPEGVEVKEGDKVEVDTQRGIREVEVVSVLDQRPSNTPAHVEIKPFMHVLPRAEA
jgi:primosomal protein N'